VKFVLANQRIASIIAIVTKLLICVLKKHGTSNIRKLRPNADTDTQAPAAIMS